MAYEHGDRSLDAGLLAEVVVTIPALPPIVFTYSLYENTMCAPDVVGLEAAIAEHACAEAAALSGDRPNTPHAATVRTAVRTQLSAAKKHWMAEWF